MIQAPVNRRIRPLDLTSPPRTQEIWSLPCPSALAVDQCKGKVKCRFTRCHLPYGHGFLDACLPLMPYEEPALAHLLPGVPEARILKPQPPGLPGPAGSPGQHQLLQGMCRNIRLDQRTSLQRPIKFWSFTCLMALDQG